MSYIKSKYPRTPHLPWSQGASQDDHHLLGTGFFYNKDVVVTVKMDGENTNLYRDDIHARSPNSGSHPSRDWVKNLHGRIKHMIPYGYRICGENLYAKHSIHYKNLEDLFLVFAVYDPGQKCLGWGETEAWAYKLGLETVPVLYRGKFDADKIKALYQEKYNGDDMEGYVVRLEGEFAYSAHRHSVAKFVRANHVKTSDHWMHQALETNGVKKNPGVID